MVLPLSAPEFEGGWDVFGAYGISQGQLCVASHPSRVRYYRPSDHPELPFEIAKLATATERELCRFAKQWGFLGFWRLWTNRQHLPRWYYALPDDDSFASGAVGEPIDWIRSHARRLALCISLIDALQQEDGEKAAAAFRSFLDADTRAPFGVALWAYETLFRTRPVADYEGDYEEAYEKAMRSGDPIGEALSAEPLEVAKEQLELLLNSHTDGIRHYFKVKPLFSNEDTATYPASRYHYTAMIELAYLHVGHLLMERAGIDRCEECGSPFRKSHGRQRFCPPGPFEGESRCGYKARYRRLREGNSHVGAQ